MGARGSSLRRARTPPRRASEMPDPSPIASFLLQASGGPDATRMLAETSWLADLANIGQSLVSLLVLVMLVMIVVILFSVKRSLDAVTALVQRSYDPVREVILEARTATTEVKAIAQSIREPALAMGATMTETGTRVRRALDRAEARLQRLDTLLAIVQEEVEDVVVRSASMVRGVRVGGRVLGLALGLARANGKRRKHAGEATGDATEAEYPDDALLDDEDELVEEDLAGDVLADDEGESDQSLEGPRLRVRTSPPA